MNCNGNEAAFEDKTAIPERRLWLAIIVQALEEWRSLALLFPRIFGSVC